MVLTQRAEVRQSQSLAMTPQLTEAIRLLGLSRLELGDYVAEEVRNNPLLEYDETTARTGDSGSMTRPGPGEERPGTRDSPPSHAQGPSPASGDAPEPAAHDMSLREHLYRQLGLEIAAPVERLIGAHLIEMLDENGYLTDDPCEVASVLGCSPDTVTRVLARLQTFDPAGVFARSLAHCLELQLREQRLLDPPMRALLDNLDLLARRDLARLQRCCGVDEDRLRDLIRRVRSLDPKPGSRFDAGPLTPLVPDILMHEGPGGTWQIELNPDTVPRILVNTGLLAPVMAGHLSDRDRLWLNGCRQSANWLVKALQQRATTMLRVTDEIVRRQRAFFELGVQHLRPLVLNDIAETLEMHESTISRATGNKSVATPRGVFELKYFFTSSVGSLTGEPAHSSEAIRDRIRRLIDREPSDAVLSDDGLVRILRTQGVDIARRTVAKYREQMRIPSRSNAAATRPSGPEARAAANAPRVACGNGRFPASGWRIEGICSVDFPIKPANEKHPGIGNNEISQERTHDQPN